MLNTKDLIRRARARFHRTCVIVRENRVARIVFRVVAGVALVPLVVVLTAFYVNFNRTNLPDLDGFIRFEPPTTGHVYDANGHVLIELGRERRDLRRFEEIPDVVRGAILSAEDENFFSHSGVDYSVFFRLLAKTNVRALAAHFTTTNDEDASKRPLVFPQGGSTITQQLVRCYFLQKLSSTKNSNSLQHEGVLPHVLAFVIGVPGANKLLLKIETIRLSLWIEGEMRKQYGSKRRAKEELFARYASFVYLGNGRYGFAAASEYYFHKPIETFTLDDADKAATLAGITKSPAEYAPTVEDLQKPTHRRNQILNLMVGNHFLPAQVAQRLMLAPVNVATHTVEAVEAPAAVETTLEELSRFAAGLGSEIGIEQLLGGHIQVYSTVDHRIQHIVNVALANGRVQTRTHHPVGESPTEAKRLKPRSLGGAVARKQDGEALRQHARKGVCATHQVATYSERRCSLVTRKSGG